jgi:hypothetical protein
VRDDFCATMPHRRWTQKIPADQLAKALQSDERTNVGARLVSINVTKRDATGRAEAITIEGARRRLVRGWDFKLIVGRVLGWQMIKSSRFEVSRAGGDFIFRGFGFGHGLGLCQEGAHVAARRGMSYRQILNHYFPGTRLTRMDPGRFERSSLQTEFAGHFLSRGATVDPSPAFQSRVGGRTVVSVAAATVDIDRQHQPSLPRLGTDALIVPALKSRAKLTWSLPRPGKMWLHYLLKDHKPTAKFKAPLCGGASRTMLPTEIGMMTIGGTQKSSISSEHFRVTYPAKTDRRSIEIMLRTFENARADLLRRLEAASLRLAEPGPFEVVVHPTTADFIAATGQGGWAAGATRGRRIDLQPLDLLRRRGVMNTTLRHEMTHAVIELLSRGRAPRWMAEGLAIHVAGEAATLPRIENKIRLSREDLERKLMRSSAVTESRKLYANAYHEIQAMIEAEGEAGVWRRVAYSQ